MVNTLKNEPERFCLICPVVSVENCEVCYGRGVLIETLNGGLLYWQQCPECGGTPQDTTL